MRPTHTHTHHTKLPLQAKSKRAAKSQLNMPMAKRLLRLRKIVETNAKV